MREIFFKNFVDLCSITKFFSANVLNHICRRQITDDVVCSTSPTKNASVNDINSVRIMNIAMFPLARQHLSYSNFPNDLVDAVATYNLLNHSLQAHFCSYRVHTLCQQTHPFEKSLFLLICESFIPRKFPDIQYVCRDVATML